MTKITMLSILGIVTFLGTMSGDVEGTKQNITDSASKVRGESTQQLNENEELFFSHVQQSQWNSARRLFNKNKENIRAEILKKSNIIYR